MLSIYSLNHCRISRNNTVVIAFGHRDHHWPRCPLLLAADLAALPSVCLVHATQTAAISDLERPVASIDRISFTVSRDTVISSILPGRARQSNRPGKPYGEGRAPGPRGAALLLKLLNFRAYGAHFPVITRTTS